MKTNFKIIDHYAIEYEGRYIDLHNNFDFIERANDTNKKEITLKFTKSEGNWVKNDELTGLTFLLKNVNYYYFQDGDDGVDPEDSKSLIDLTFFPSDDREENNSVTLEPEPQEGDDLIFQFQDGRIIRVNCDEAEVLIKE